MHLDANLVVIMQENRILSNYPFLIWRIVGGPKIAYWGHGINFQSSAPTGLRERWKKLIIRHVDWWFAYTQVTVDILLAARFENRKITCLDNAIDTCAFRNEVSSISNGELETIRQQLRIDENARIGLFCGSLYPDKKLELLIDSADKIRDREPRFHLIVIGNGPSADMLNRVSQSRSWMHMVGVKKGREKAIYFRLAQVMLNPGSTGLHILDAFSIGMPIVSTIDARHGPEIVYLQNGVNGVLTEDSIDTYSNAVLDLLCNESLREKISRNALVTGEQYTVDRMACNFIHGIEKCLDSAP
jgi:glycosyltransferase involved in cell wall biosynthesis